MTTTQPETACVIFVSSLHIMDFGPDLHLWHFGVWSPNGQSERWQNQYWFQARDWEVMDRFQKPAPEWLRNLYVYALRQRCDWLVMGPEYDIIDGFPINEAFREPLEP